MLGGVDLYPQHLEARGKQISVNSGPTGFTWFTGFRLAH